MKSRKIPDRNFILKQLYRGVVNLTFTKTNGESRTMNATLATQLIESNQLKESSPNPPGNDDLVVCWDVEEKGWRSFKVSTITEYKG